MPELHCKSAFFFNIKINLVPEINVESRNGLLRKGGKTEKKKIL